MPADPLIAFLLSALDVAAMRALARELDPVLTYLLPAKGEGGSPMQAATALSQGMRRHGLLDARFFRVLLARLPAREAEIEDLRSQIAPELEPVDAGSTQAVWSVPGPPVRLCGRDRELRRLAELDAEVISVVGLAGLGKRTVARAWAEADRDAVAFGARLRASSEQVLGDDLLALGQELGVVQVDGDRETALARVREHLQDLPRSGPGFVLVLEEAGDPDSIELPRGHGRVLITTRDRRWLVHGEPLELEPLPLPACRQLLQHALIGEGNSDTAADALAESLGRLPLALVQANAWCVTTGQTLAAAHQRLRTSSRILGHAAGHGEISLDRSWSLAVDAVSEQAQHLLELLAFLDPDDVPIEGLFMAGPDALLRLVPDALHPLLGAPDALDDCVGELHRACLVDRRGPRLSLHPLVQRITRDRLSDAASTERLAQARALVRRVLMRPHVVRFWPLWRELVPHVLALIDAPDGPLRVDLQHELGSWLLTQGRYAQAAELLEQAVQGWEALHGPEHDHVSRGLLGLGAALSKLHQPERALQVLRRARDLTGEHRGAEHPDMAYRHGAIAEALLIAGDYAAAAYSMRQARQVAQAHAPSRDDDSVAWWSDGLATILLRAGALDQAQQAAEHAVRVGESTYGPQHTYVAVRRAHLASVLRARGRAEQALPHHQHALTVLSAEQAYGPGHPFVATVLGERGATRCELGDADGEDDLVQALARSATAVGEQDPRTARRRLAWGRALRRRGQASLALPAIRDAHAHLAQTVGQDHPDTLAAVVEHDLTRHVVHGDGSVAALRQALQRLAARLPEGDPPEHWVVARLRAEIEALQPR